MAGLGFLGWRARDAPKLPKLVIPWNCQGGQPFAMGDGEGRTLVLVCARLGASQAGLGMVANKQTMTLSFVEPLNLSTCPSEVACLSALLAMSGELSYHPQSFALGNISGCTSLVLMTWSSIPFTDGRPSCKTIECENFTLSDSNFTLVEFHKPESLAKVTAYARMHAGNKHANAYLGIHVAPEVDILCLHTMPPSANNLAMSRRQPLWQHLMPSYQDTLPARHK